MKKSWSNFGQFERIGSTYAWRIVFLNGSERKGYSKPLGQSEPYPHDKQLLLLSVMRRLLINNGYLQKIQQIHFERCFSDHDRDNVSICTVYPARYTLGLEVAAMPPEQTAWLRSFLDGLYRQKEEVYGREMFPKADRATGEKNQQEAPRRANFDQLLDPSRPRFRTPADLLDFCNGELAKLSVPHGRITHFYHCYMEKHFC